MGPESRGRETVTRRDYVKYGGALVGGGLLAGCTGGNGADPSETPAETGRRPRTTRTR